ncbi:MAG: hypothetical protein ACFFB6_02465 [Promethearchaeota archaeon]
MRNIQKVGLVILFIGLIIIIATLVYYLPSVNTSQGWSVLAIALYLPPGIILFIIGLYLALRVKSHVSA